VTNEKQTKRYFVSGNVQGVGYRFFVQRAAEKLGIGGFARNLYDGRVEVFATGSPSRLAELRTALERGPRFASVSGIREEQAEPSPLFEKSFVIEPDA
jgi:acylphosphatase